MKLCLPFLLISIICQPLVAREIHVSIKGDDDAAGSAAQPLRTISTAAEMAVPGDEVIVHEGVYRERITPPRGGLSDSERIVYQAAEGARPVVKGSEIVKGWKRFAGDAWKLTLPNSFFGGYNPYKDEIQGDWLNDKGRPHHTGAVYINERPLYETHLIENVLNPKPYQDARKPEDALWAWYCESDDENTYIYANFQGGDPNRETVEINVRPACFYPDQPGRDYITIRGFIFRHAATQWAAPTAEQPGLIGTHYSKGWIIENNIISDSRCSGITLGKERATGHNVWSNNPKKDGATHYNEVIVRALKNGWSKDTVGSHIIRNNTIYRCEQTGICGSLGGIFSRIENNHIYDIHIQRQFTGAEMAGIKIHAAIDMVIYNNQIHNAARGLWLDWMAQGTRVSRNLFYDNTTDDLFVEVNHGPFVIDNNLFLSDLSLRDWSQGGAYIHNLFAGEIESRVVLGRSTPYHLAHSTKLMGITKILGGDNRFFNNIFIGDGDPPERSDDADADDTFRGYGLWVYDTREAHLLAAGNVYCHAADAYVDEPWPLNRIDHDPELKIVERGNQGFLTVDFESRLNAAHTEVVDSERLGKTRIAELGFEEPDGSPIHIDYDFFGRKRDDSPTPGPFEDPGASVFELRLW